MIMAEHEFQERQPTAFDANGRARCARCGQPRSYHPHLCDGVRSGVITEHHAPHWWSGGYCRGIGPFTYDELADSPPGLHPLDTYLITLHDLLGHDRAADYLGVDRVTGEPLERS